MWGRGSGVVILIFVASACASPLAVGTRTSAGAASPAPPVDGSPATTGSTDREPDLAGLFDVGGHSLYLECRGTSGPVILFDAGSGSDGATWHRSRKDFIGLVDPTYRRCTYDRANLGGSGSVAGPRTSATAAQEMHSLLRAADLPPPYVLVGRSFGGYNVRLFAAAYPSETKALVLVETLTPEFQDGVKSLLTPEQWAEEARSFDALEPPMDELASGPLVAAAVIPDVPLLVVAGTKWHAGNAPWPADWPGADLDDRWAKAQANLAASVPRGKLVVFEGGDHSLHFSQPERLADEINAFLAAL